MSSCFFIVTRSLYLRGYSSTLTIVNTLSNMKENEEYESPTITEAFSVSVGRGPSGRIRRVAVRTHISGSHTFRRVSGATAGSFASLWCIQDRPTAHMRCPCVILTCEKGIKTFPLLAKTLPLLPGSEELLVPVPDRDFGDIRHVTDSTLCHFLVCQ